MPVAPLHLIPPPRRLRRLAGCFDPASCRAIRIPHPCPRAIGDLAADLAARLGDAGTGAPEVTRTARPGAGGIELRTARLATPEAHRIEIETDRVTLTGGGDAGLFYAVQTFLQILAQRTLAGLPCLRIDDAPAFAVRGFYHDVSRGKVPTLATLRALVERLAHYKINHLQLYLEHTFAFARHPDIWAGCDPLTADDIRELDEHAARHHVELVPSLSTFGHFYTALVAPRKHGLNELPIDASRLPFSWWDRMGHYTLDCTNPASLALVRELILELAPLFRSRHFNLCCDETFDLGKGRNAALAARAGVGRLYLDFLRELIAIVRGAGRTPMFWGDIVGNHPELVAGLPRDVVALDWDYSPDLKDTKARLFRKAGIPFLVCPGVTGWDRWLNDLDTATTNILGFARRGLGERATGLLNTDWGDRGHINPLGNSLHGALLGAAAAWNPAATEPTAFDAAFARLEWDDPSGRVVALLRESARHNVVSWRLFTLWLDPTPHRPATWWEARTDVPVDLLALDPRRAFASANTLDRLRARIERSTARNRPADPLVRREWLLGCRGQAALNRLGGWIISLAKDRPPPRGAPAVEAVADELRRFEAEFSALWHARNRPSEYWRLRTTLLELARRLELAARGVWLLTPRPAPPPAPDGPGAAA